MADGAVATELNQNLVQRFLQGEVLAGGQVASSRTPRGVRSLLPLICCFSLACLVMKAVSNIRYREELTNIVSLIRAFFKIDIINASRLQEIRAVTPQGPGHFHSEMQIYNEENESSTKQAI